MGDQGSLRDTTELPSTYREHRMVDLKKDKKFAGAVQGLFVLMALVAVGAALLLELPLETSWSSILTISVTLFACLIYMAVHEATHGVVLQTLTKVKPSYAVRFPFLTTGNHAYLTRRSAVVVALAPAVIWGIVLVAALLTLPQDYLRTLYILLALNFAGSAGDCVEAYVVSRQQPDALVQDAGDKVHVFVPQDSR
jgi:Putative zincin peptidase